MAKKAKALTCSVVIVAAGQSTRMGGNVRKPYLSLRGKPILGWTLSALGRLPMVRQIVVVTRPEDRPRARRIIKAAGLPKRVSVVFAEGGNRRQDSVFNGIKTTSEAHDIVLIHDAARPFPPKDAMIQAIHVSNRSGASILAIPVRDTVKRERKSTHENHADIATTVSRDGLWLAQTPQVFKRDLITKLFERLARTPKAEVTDEASVCEKFKVPVALIASSSLNLKVTKPEDLPIAEAYLRQGLVR